MSKVIAEYNARFVVLKQNEESMDFTGSLTLCDDGKVLGVVSRFEGPDNARHIIGMHYKIQHGGTISIARLDDRGIFEDMAPSDLAVLHGDYLPESTGSREFGGLHSVLPITIPQSILKPLVYGRAFVSGEIERFREVPVADLEQMLHHKRKLYDGSDANQMEKWAVKNGQTAQLFLTPQA